MAAFFGAPLVTLVGDIGEGIESTYERGVTAIFSINTLAITIDNLLRFANIWKSKRASHPPRRFFRWATTDR